MANAPRFSLVRSRAHADEGRNPADHEDLVQPGEERMSLKCRRAVREEIAEPGLGPPLEDSAEAAIPTAT
jgi:hypothetical protein